MVDLSKVPESGLEVVPGLKPEVTLRNWTITDYGPKSMGARVLWGETVGHPRFPDGSFVRTSQVVKFDEANGVAETLNTRYMLVDKVTSNSEKLDTKAVQPE